MLFADRLLTFPVVSFVAIVILTIYYWYKRPANMPPGPRGLPFVGVIPFLGDHPEVVINNWAKVYGNIFTIRMGMKDWIVLNDFYSMKQGLVKNHEGFSDRPEFPLLEPLTTKGNGIISINYTEKYKEQRKFGLLTLRGLGVGKHSMEERIIEEMEYLNETIREQNGKPFDIQENLAKAVSNNICSIVFGARFDYDNPTFIKLLEILKSGFSNGDEASVVSKTLFAPFLKFIPPFRGQLNKVINNIKSNIELLKVIIEDHKKEFDIDNPKDFIDAFLTEIKKGTHKSFTDLQLLAFIRELFIAGTETTKTITTWEVLCFIHYPQTQEKLHAEIQGVIGESGTVSYAMKDKMPYTMAFIQEIFRYRTLVPLNAPHKTNKETRLEGFTIPKGTSVISNIWAIHNNPKLWKEPEKFVPERHINEKGEFVNCSEVIPFSIGPRHCLGEQLARMEVFIFLVSLVQKFKFLPDPSAKELPCISDGYHGTIFTPIEYKVVAEER